MNILCPKHPSEIKYHLFIFVPWESILEWELALEQDGQLVRNNNVMYCLCNIPVMSMFLVHKVLKSL